MGSGLLYALAGLGQGTKGLPEGMIAGQKLDQSQQQLDELARHRKVLEDSQSTDVGQLFTALGIPAPGGLTGRVPNTVATAAAGQAVKEKERQRALGEREKLAAGLEGMGRGTPPTPAATEEPGLYSPGTPADPKFAAAARFARAGAGVDTLFKHLYPDHDKPMVVDKHVYNPTTGAFVSPPKPEPLGAAEIPPGTRPKLEVDQAGGQKKVTYEYPPQATQGSEVVRLAGAISEAEAKGDVATAKRLRAQLDDVKSYVLGEGGQVVGGGTRTPIASGPPKTQPLPAGEAATNADLRSFVKDLRSIGENYSTKFSGPVQGRLGALRNVTGIGASAEEADFRTQLASFENRLLRLRSGAAVTPQEYERIKNELPQASDPEVVFRAKLGRAISAAEQALSTREAEFSSRGFRGQAPAAPTPSRGNDPLGIRR